MLGEMVNDVGRQILEVWHVVVANRLKVSVGRICGANVWSNAGSEERIAIRPTLLQYHATHLPPIGSTPRLMRLHHETRRFASARGALSRSEGASLYKTALLERGVVPNPETCKCLENRMGKHITLWQHNYVQMWIIRL